MLFKTVTFKAITKLLVPEFLQLFPFVNLHICNFCSVYVLKTLYNNTTPQ